MTIEIVKLGDVADYIRGITFKPADVVPAHSPDSVVCMTTKNVQATLDESKLTAVPPRFVKRAEQYLQCGDILISSANSWNLVGKATYVPKLSYAATAGGFISILRAQDEKVDPRYLYNWVSSGATQHRARLCARQTTNIANLDRGRFLGLKIPLPPLPEQRRIAAILDKADAVRRKRHQTLDLADQFLRSAFLDLFGDPVTNPMGWPVVSMSQVAESERGSIVIGPFGSDLKTTDYRSEGHPVVFVRDVREGRLTWSSGVHVDDAKFEQLSSHRVQPGDVVATKMGTPPGIAAVYPANMPEGIVTADIVRVRPDASQVEAMYLADSLNSRFVRAQIRRITEGVTRPKITLRAFKQLRVLLAPLGTQEDWCELRSRAQTNLLRQCELHSRQLEELQGVLTQRAFRGEL